MADRISRIKFDPMPQAIAGICTAKCECGWEALFVQPEENIIMMNRVFQHLVTEHGIALPPICCYWH